MTVRYSDLQAICTSKPATLKHLPAVWEAILGTVYATSPEGCCKFFDYDYKAAFEFAGLLDAEGKLRQDLDARWAPCLRPAQFVKSGDTHANPKVGKFCVWVNHSAAKLQEVGSK